MIKEAFYCLEDTIVTSVPVQRGAARGEKVISTLIVSNLDLVCAVIEFRSGSIEDG
jgi:hypothetical protein